MATYCILLFMFFGGKDFILLFMFFGGKDITIIHNYCHFVDISAGGLFVHGVSSSQ